MKTAWVYILCDHPFGTLYIGVTAHIAKRIEPHKAGNVSGFAQRYKLRTRVYCKEHPTIMSAIQREKAMKKWRRHW